MKTVGSRLGMKTVGNDRENITTVPAPVLFKREREQPDGNTNSILRDIGNEIFRSGTFRLRSGIGNTKREH
jgi:hypothetical protein